MGCMCHRHVKQGIRQPDVGAIPTILPPPGMDEAQDSTARTATAARAALQARDVGRPEAPPVKRRRPARRPAWRGDSSVSCSPPPHKLSIL